MIIVLWLHKIILSATFPPWFFEELLYFQIPQDVPESFYIFTFPRIGISIFFKESLLFIVESCLEIKIWALGVLISTRLTCISINSQWTKLRYIRMYSYTHTYIHISVSINLSFKNHEITLMITLIQTQYRRVCHRLPSFLFFNYLFILIGG